MRAIRRCSRTHAHATPHRAPARCPAQAVFLFCFSYADPPSTRERGCRQNKTQSSHRITAGGKRRVAIPGVLVGGKIWAPLPLSRFSRWISILWPRWVARIGLTRSTQACLLTADRQCTELPLYPTAPAPPCSLAPLGAGGVAVAVSLFWERERFSNREGGTFCETETRNAICLAFLTQRLRFSCRAAG